MEVKERPIEAITEPQNSFDLECLSVNFDLNCECEVCRLQREETDARRALFLRELGNMEEGDSNGR